MRNSLGRCADKEPPAALADPQAARDRHALGKEEEAAEERIEAAPSAGLSKAAQLEGDTGGCVSKHILSRYC